VLKLVTKLVDVLSTILGVKRHEDGQCDEEELRSHYIFILFTSYMHTWRRWKGKRQDYVMQSASHLCKKLGVLNERFSYSPFDFSPNIFLGSRK
jgi:hypothetical protein